MQSETLSTPKIATQDEVLSFWLDDTGPTGWYKSDPDFDDLIRDRFLATWQAARCGHLADWMLTPTGKLALIIVLDQFSRNMFRGHSDSFTTDAAARSVAKKAIDKGWDTRVPEPQRVFFYMPLMHSECLVDQDRCVRLMATRLPDTGDKFLPHAQAHRDIIREFGRFPYRNDALGRTFRTEETAYMDRGGYGASIRSFQMAEAV